MKPFSSVYAPLAWGLAYADGAFSAIIETPEGIFTKTYFPQIEEGETFWSTEEKQNEANLSKRSLARKG